MALSAASSITALTWASICSWRRCRLTRKCIAKHTAAIAAVHIINSIKKTLITTEPQDNRIARMRMHSRSSLHTDRERLGTVLFGALAHHSVEAALQQRHQTRVPISKDKQDEERHRYVIFVGDSVPDSQREIAADQQLNIRNPAQAFAILLRRDGLFRLVHHTIFWCAGKRALVTYQPPAQLCCW